MVSLGWCLGGEDGELTRKTTLTFSKNATMALMMKMEKLRSAVDAEHSAPLMTRWMASSSKMSFQTRKGAKWTRT